MIVWDTTDAPEVEPSNAKVMTGHRLKLKVIGDNLGTIRWDVQGPCYKEYEYFENGSGASVIDITKNEQTIQLSWRTAGNYNVEVSTAAGSASVDFEVKAPEVEEGLTFLSGNFIFTQSQISSGETVRFIFQMTQPPGPGFETTNKLLRLEGSGPDQDWGLFQIIEYMRVFVKRQVDLEPGHFQCLEYQGTNLFDRNVDTNGAPTAGYWDPDVIGPYSDSPFIDLGFDAVRIEYELHFKTYLLYGPDNDDIPKGETQKIGNPSNLAPLKSMTWKISGIGELVSVNEFTKNCVVLAPAFPPSKTAWVNESSLPTWNAFAPKPPPFQEIQCPQ